MNKQKTKAFTLVELIVVITILAILGTIAFISLQGYSKDARDATRTSDIHNIKTSLELFSLSVGKYPKPDNYETINYQSDDVRYQGTVGDNMTKNLQKLNEKPTDPLFNTEYIYSTTSLQKEFEVLALYEGDQITSNMLISQTYAANNLYPKIDGTYNQVFVKTKNYIVATPSIITSEIISGGYLLTGATIDSQVITGGSNIPAIGGNEAQTGGLVINLSATGTITSNATDAEKISIIEIIQTAYSGTTLSTNNVYAYILNQITNEEKIALANMTVLDGEIVSSATGDILCEVGYYLVNGSCELDLRLTTSVLLTTDQINTLKTWYGDVNKEWILCYRSSRDGTLATTFHTNCDNKGPTLSIYKFGSNLVGGYGSSSWDTSITGYLSNTDSWLFNLNTSTKQIVITTLYAQYTKFSHMPTFGGGHDLVCQSGLVACYANDVGSYGSPSPVYGYVTSTADDLEVYY